MKNRTSTESCQRKHENQNLYRIENGVMEDISYRFLPHPSKKISKKKRSNGCCFYRLGVTFWV